MTRPPEAERRLIQGRSLRWDETRTKAAYAAGLWVNETLADALDRAAADTPDRVLIVDGAVTLTAEALRTRAIQLASALLKRAAPGSVVSFMLPNWHEAVVIYLASTYAGMVAHPILPSLRDNELRFMLHDVESRFVFIPSTWRNEDYAAMLGRVKSELHAPPEIVVLRGPPGEHTAYASMLEQDSAASPKLDPDSVRMILYTSGTTGTPKGVMHSHNSIHALVRQIGQHWQVASGDAFLVASPISHIGGSIYAFEAPLLLGCSAVLMERWDADAAVALALQVRFTHMAGATPFLEQLLDAARRADTHLPDLKVFICGGASVPPSLIRNAAAHFDGAIVSRVYGSTEVPVTTVGTMDRADLAHAADTDGAPGLADVRIVDADGADAGEGEIRAMGPQMLVGYLHSEDEPAAFDENGYYRTGDIGRLVDGKFLVISGRAKDIIIRNGENISPKEVEDILADHPDIAEVAIVGMPDPNTGERACAVIVPKLLPGPDVAALRAHLSALGVAKFKFPEDVLIVDALPKNDAGKVLKHRIRAMLARTEG